MTLKNSFLARLIENAKRRIWLLVVSLLLFVLAIPIYTGMNISIISKGEYLMQHLIEPIQLKEELYRFASNIYSPSNLGLLFLVGVFAVVSAIQGFSYLYDRKKIDFYNSKPVKASERFFSIWLNGILVWLLPFLVGTLLNLVLFAANGILDVVLFGNAWKYLLIAFGFYLCLYHLAILALMLTGKVGVTCMGILVFLFYEVSIRALLGAYFDYFYQFFYIEEVNKWLIPLLSPITPLKYYSNGEWGTALTFFMLLLFAVVIGAVAYWCYKKRPAEMAGSAMTFSVIKPIIKIAIAVPAGLFAGIMTCNFVGYVPANHAGSPGFPILIGILAVWITCCLIQVIYEADIKGIFHKKAHIAISLVLTFSIALIFRFDLTGFDKRLPDEEEIVSAAFLTDHNYSSYLDEGLRWIYKEQYINKHMRLSKETAQDLRKLAEHSAKLFFEQTENEFEDDYEYCWSVVTFYKENGRRFCREIPIAINDDTTISYLKKIVNTQEFITANEEGMSEELERVLYGNEWPVLVYWQNGLNKEEMSRKQARELLELYRIDLMQDNYEIKSRELPMGDFFIYIETQTSYSRSINLKVYPSYANCMQYLEKNGFLTDFYILPENVEKITVTREYYEENISEGETGMPDTTEYARADKEVKNVTKTYEEPEQIKEILEHAYPSCLEWNDWYYQEPFESGYYIKLYFKEGSQVYVDRGYESPDLYFFAGEVPEFVKQDIPD